mmetsp:Transcript_74714/g.155757  ORF Transcript_74714/g.155757 Transcript_74714/m.155757 type:complete len:281 (-) Transcript_74714:43-885(-)
MGGLMSSNNPEVQAGAGPQVAGTQNGLCPYGTTASPGDDKAAASLGNPSQAPAVYWNESGMGSSRASPATPMQSRGFGDPAMQTLPPSTGSYVGSVGPESLKSGAGGGGGIGGVLSSLTSSMFGGSAAEHAYAGSVAGSQHLPPPPFANSGPPTVLGSQASQPTLFGTQGSMATIFGTQATIYEPQNNPLQTRLPGGSTPLNSQMSARNPNATTTSGAWSSNFLGSRNPMFSAVGLGPIQENDAYGTFGPPPMVDAATKEPPMEKGASWLWCCQEPKIAR